MKNLRKNVNGFVSHHLLIPAIVILAVAGIGTYIITKSKAESAPTVSGLFGYHCNYDPAPTQHQGNTGECVKVLQTGLNNYDNVANFFAKRVIIAPLTVDGNFGAKTTAAVKFYQGRHKLTADGIVGPATWSVFVNSCVTLNGGNASCFTSGAYN